MIKKFAIVLLFLMLLPVGSGAPDSQPSLEWDVTAAILNPDCPGVVQTRGNDLTTDLNGNVYILISCQGSLKNDLVIIKYASATGAKIWEYAISCINDLNCMPHGIAADSAGYIGVAYWDEGSGAATRTMFRLIKQTTGETSCTVGAQGVTYPNGFTSDIGQMTSTQIARSLVAYKNTNSTTIYAIGGPSGVAAVIVNTPTDCRELWTSTAHGEYGLTYNRVTGLLTATTANPVNRIANLNALSGAAGATQTSTVLTHYSSNSTGNTLWTMESLPSCPGSGILFREYNATTLTSIRTVTPIENQIYDGATPLTTCVRVSEGWHIDGANSIFPCGLYEPGGVGSRPMAMKFNTTQLAGQRWNVTWSAAIVGIDNGQVSKDCEISKFGALYVLWDDRQSAENVHVRKYTNAGTTIIRDTAYVLPGDTGGSGGGAGSCDTGNFIQCYKQFLDDSWGFDWAWLLGMIVVGITVFAVAKRTNNTLVIAIFAFLGFGLAVFFELFPVWSMFVLVFLIIAVAASRLFGTDAEASE